MKVVSFDNLKSGMTYKCIGNVKDVYLFKDSNCEEESGFLLRPEEKFEFLESNIERFSVRIKTNSGKVGWMCVRYESTFFSLSEKSPSIGNLYTFDVYKFFLETTPVWSTEYPLQQDYLGELCFSDPHFYFVLLGFSSEGLFVKILTKQGIIGWIVNNREIIEYQLEE